MLRTLDLPAGLPVREGCLYKRHDVQRATGAQDLTAQARVRARMLVDEAQGRADQIEAAAYARGCQAGLMHTFAMLHRYLCDVRGAREQVCTALHAHLVDALQPVFADNDAVLTLLQSALKSALQQGADQSSGDLIEVFLPAVSARDAYHLRRSLSATHPHIAIQTAPHPTQCAVRWGATVLKFDLADMAGRAVGDALDATLADGRFEQILESAHAAARVQLRDVLRSDGDADRATPPSGSADASTSASALPHSSDHPGHHVADF